MGTDPLIRARSHRRSPGTDIGVRPLSLLFVTALLSACGAGSPPAVSPHPGRPQAAAPANCGVVQKQRFEEPGLPARDYYVYAACSAATDGTAPLVVYLHGCLQTAHDAIIQTRWNAQADAHGLVVAYPEQFDPNSEPVSEEQVRDHVFDGNGSRCWNWFRPDHIARGAGEAAAIAGITQRLIGQYAIDPRRVYVGGISAGGAMTGALAASYPDLYAAAAMIVGEAYPAATDATGLLAWQAMGAYARPMPFLIVQGSLDELVPVPQGEMNLSQWLGTNDLVDDGLANGSVPRTPASHEDHGLDPGALAGLGTTGDLCLDQEGSPCPGGALGFSSYPYSIDRYVDAAGAPLGEWWLIHGIMHSYAGGDPSVSFSDPLGPDITQASYDFFMAHPRSPP